jgi:hypothetical protein
VSRLSRTIRGWVGLAVVVTIGILVWNNRLALGDDFRLIGYTPPAAISTLAANIGFTAQGQRDFYVMHPSIEDQSSFNAHCGSHESGQQVLGCYTGTGIYVYNVSDPRLDGVEEVTAAHETLHAAYARLSDSQRSSVNAILERQYAKLSQDAAFKQRFSVYDSLSYADRLNELHSIFGTEEPTLSTELEGYYKQYFKDRGILPADYAKYQGPFNTLKNRQAALKIQIDTLKADIQSAEARYATDRTALNDDISAFNQRSRSGVYTSQSQFESDRSALTARSTALNGEADQINAKINQYNSDIAEYNALSVQTQTLQNSLDSNAVPSVPSV